MASVSDVGAADRVESHYGLELAGDPPERANERDFVCVGPASLTLARLTIRRPVGAALDLGTGNGFQALLAARHADHVVGVDISERALDFARLNARRNGVENAEWRQGSWLEPVRGEHFDLVVANPPYVISPDSRLLYRDSGEPGDALVRRLLGELPDSLAEGGFAQVLCNWAVGPDGEWRSSLEQAFAGRGCDALILRYAVFEPRHYAELWHRDGEVIDRWCEHYRELGIEAIATGVVVLRRRAGRNWIRAVVVPAAPTDDAGEHLLRLFTGQDWVRAGARGLARPPRGARLVSRVSLDDGAERMTLEVRPNVGFAAGVDPAVGAALRRSERLPASDVERLVGLGLLIPLDLSSRQAEDRSKP